MTQPKRSTATIVRIGATVVLVVVAAMALARRWADVSDAAGRLALDAVAYALIAVLAGAFSSFMSWRAVMADLGAAIPLGAGLRVYFVGQLAKYIPGSVWQPLAQMELGRDHGVARRVTVVASGVALLIVLGAGVLVAVLSVPFAGAGAVGRYLWILAAFPLVVVLVYPPVLNRLLETAMRILRREAMPKPLSFRGVVKATGWSLAVWLLYGVHTWVLARSLYPGSARLLALSIAAFAVAWVVGFVVVVAPAGAVAREAALVVLLHRMMPIGEATTVALVSRLLFTVADLGWGLAGAMLGARRKPE